MHRYSSLAVWGLLAAALGAQTPAATPAVQVPAREPGLYATIRTSMGPVTVKMFEKEAPVTVKNFLDLELGRKAWKDQKTGEMVQRPLYDGTTFHRVISGFMIQGGDPKGDGTGDAGFTIKDEFAPSLKFDIPGRLAMANVGQPNTGACQFFITVVPTPHLNGKHTIFGQVIEGQDVVNKIAIVRTDRFDRPLKPVRITKITFERVRATTAPAKASSPARAGAPAKQ